MQKTFDVPGPVELDIRLASGEIEVDPSLEGRVEVELTAHDDESERLIEATRVELADRRLLIDVPQRRGGFTFGIVFGRSGISCRVRCPEGSGLDAKTKSADVLARGTLGKLYVATASGEVSADRVTGSVNVKTASGEVDVREAGDEVTVQSASGDIDVGSARGAVSVNTASGDVRIGDAGGDVSANTVSGDLELGAVLRGRVGVHSVSGDVRVGVRRGAKAYLDCTSVSGDMSSELDGLAEPPAGDGPFVEIKARTVSGDVTIMRAPAPATEEEVRT